MCKIEFCQKNCLNCEHSVGVTAYSQSNDQIINQLQTNGYTVFDKGVLNFQDNEAEWFEHLRLQARAMPLDHTDGGAGRARLYGKAVIMPWKEEGCDIEYVPGQTNHFNGEWGLEYTQPASVNAVSGGKRRVFQPFSDELYNNPLIEKWTRKLLSFVSYKPDLKQGLVAVGYHLVRLAPAADSPAVASPDLVHRDGEWFTAAILIERENVTGGVNAVTGTEWHSCPFRNVPKEQILSEFTLNKPMEGYLVADDQVAHYVGPVHRKSENFEGNRTVLLIDFTPYCPDINLSGIEH